MKLQNKLKINNNNNKMQQFAIVILYNNKWLESVSHIDNYIFYNFIVVVL